MSRPGCPGGVYTTFRDTTDRWIFISQQIEGDMTVLPPRMAEKGLVALRESTQCFRLAELVSGHPENPARKSSGNFRD